MRSTQRVCCCRTEPADLRRAELQLYSTPMNVRVIHMIHAAQYEQRRRQLSASLQLQGQGRRKSAESDRSHHGSRTPGPVPDLSPACCFLYKVIGFIQFLRNFSPARNDPRPDLRTTPASTVVIHAACTRHFTTLYRCVACRPSHVTHWAATYCGSSQV